MYLHQYLHQGLEGLSSPGKLLEEKYLLKTYYQKNAVIYFVLQNITEVVHEGNFLKLLSTVF